MTKKIALLSCDSLEGFVCYDDLLIEPFAEFGYKAEAVSWKSDADWNEYESVIVRSTWDYQDEPESFLEVLDRIENSSAKLENSLEVMKWNFNKNYLRDLQDKGVFIIPSEFRMSFDLELAQSLYQKYSCGEIIIKPCVSANSDDTFRLSPEKLNQMHLTLAELFKSRSHMYQPFIPSVVENGEYSLFYFNGEFSHAILKTPKSGDFRVQEEHGGRLQKVDPSLRLKETAAKIVKSIEPMPLYGRVDLLEYENDYALMEVELIEPSLYFNLDDESARRFVKAYLQSREQ